MAVDGNQWTSVAYGNGRFVAVAPSQPFRNALPPLTMSSTDDGVTWNGHPSSDDTNYNVNGGPASSWNTVTYGNGRFVALGFNTAAMSSTDDGNTWTGHLSSSDGNSMWSSVTYGNGCFVAVGSRHYDDPGVIPRKYGTMTSTDNGITWTGHVSSDDNNAWASVTFGKGRFVAVAKSGIAPRTMTSTDNGITWTGYPSSNDDNQWYSVTFGNGCFVAVASGYYSKDGGKNRTMTSTDNGITWTGHPASSDDNFWNSVAYGYGFFVAVADSGYGPRTTTGYKDPRTMTSTDNGITWTGHVSPNDYNSWSINGWSSVTFGNGRFVAVAASGTNRTMIGSAPPPPPSPPSPPFPPSPPPPSPPSCFFYASDQSGGWQSISG